MNKYLLFAVVWAGRNGGGRSGGALNVFTNRE